jgi:hypothetical protein
LQHRVSAGVSRVALRLTALPRGAAVARAIAASSAAQEPRVTPQEVGVIAN